MGRSREFRSSEYLLLKISRLAGFGKHETSRGRGPLWCGHRINRGSRYSETRFRVSSAHYENIVKTEFEFSDRMNFNRNNLFETSFKICNFNIISLKRLTFISLNIYALIRIRTQRDSAFRAGVFADFRNTRTINIETHRAYVGTQA